MKCDVKKCHSACCRNVPMPKGYLTASKKRMARKVLCTEPFGDMVLPITNYDPENNICPFLNDKFRCNIYNVRPHVCRIYGDGADFLNCEFLTGKKIDAYKVTIGLLKLRDTNEAIFNRILS